MQSDRYGDVAELTRGLRVVTPSGMLVVRPVPSTSTGPSVREMVLGSEGRLGVITEATVHVRRVPERRMILGYLFPTWAAGLAAMRDIAASEAAASVTRVSDANETAFSFATRKTPSILDQLKSRALSTYLQRRLDFDIPWLTCRFPTPAMAQDAGMGFRAFEDFFYGTVLLDWDAEGEKMKRIKDRFDRADEVRIVGAETDLRFSLEGREGEIDDGHANMPGGEVFYSPVEESTEGVVAFTEYPAYQEPDLVEGVRMVYRDGRVVEASASANEEALLSKLDRDEGARVLGEFGIGCNPGIQRYMKNTLFDEKMYGTIHLAIGAGLPTIGGKNESSVHWDMVKELRNGGRIECDGEVVQENGEWTF